MMAEPCALGAVHEKGTASHVSTPHTGAAGVSGTSGAVVHERGDENAESPALLVARTFIWYVVAGTRPVTLSLVAVPVLAHSTPSLSSR